MIARALTALSLAFALPGCVSARMSDHVSNQLFRQGRYDDAAESLKKALKDQGEGGGKDELLYLLDIGLSLHAAGKYEESNQYFLKADKIAEIKDYTSLATEGATLLTSDNIKDYKGEDFEKVLINTYLAMNYALMGDYENALVEARRVNRKLYLMDTEGQRKYKQNAFARYLSAVIYEAEGNFNDAYVDYKKVQELEPGYPGLGRDLWRCAYALHMSDETDRWEEQYHLSEDDTKAARELLSRKAGKGEIIVLYENGISPIKRPHPNFYQIPKFYPRYNPVFYANVMVNGQYRAATARLHDIQATAIENLDEKYGGIIAKKIAGVVAKEVVADQIGKRTSPFVGFLAKAAMYVSDQADVRSWNLLPKDLQVARIVVDPGTYTVQVAPAGGPASGEKTVQVAAGKKVFVDYRYIPAWF